MCNLYLHMWNTQEMKHTLFVLALLCSADELMSARCQVGCKYLMFFSGQYNNDKCYCYDVFPYKEVVDVERTKLSKRKAKE